MNYYIRKFINCVIIIIIVYLSKDIKFMIPY